MQIRDQRRPIVTVILGAGASRAVSYREGGEGCSGGDFGPKMPSPLDSDFFDLLQQIEAQTEEGATREAMKRIICKALHWRGDPLWQSMEMMFYSLHVSAVLEYLLFDTDTSLDLGREVVEDFLASIRALLAEAHGSRASVKHQLLLGELDQADAVLTFNYDFVVERALADRFGRGPLASTQFGDWFYGLSDRTESAPPDIPTLYKLHGSLNWRLEEDDKGETQNARRDWPTTWAGFSQELGYIPCERQGYEVDPRWRPPVLLPYWDKRVEKGLWLRIWKGAAAQLRQTDSLIVWGYSLPTTDLKARELIRLAFRPGAKLSKVAVIDPSSETQDRWRSIFLDKQFWRFRNYEEFYAFTKLHSTTLGPFRSIDARSETQGILNRKVL